MNLIKLGFPLFIVLAGCQHPAPKTETAAATKESSKENPQDPALATKTEKKPEENKRPFPTRARTKALQGDPRP